MDSRSYSRIRNRNLQLRLSCEDIFIEDVGCASDDHVTADDIYPTLTDDQQAIEIIEEICFVEEEEEQEVHKEAYFHTEVADEGSKIKNMRMDIEEYLPKVSGNDFCIKHLIHEMCFQQSNTMCNAKMQQDDGEPLFEGSLHQKGQFARDLLDYMAMHKLDLKARQALLNLLGKYFGEVTNLPIVRKETNSLSEKFRFVSKLDDYRYKRSLNKDYFEFGICSNGCSVYVGEKEKLDHCPDCNELRWASIGSKINKEVTYYRPIIPRLQHLLRSRRFYNLLTCKIARPPESDYVVTDLMHGKEPQRQLEDMNERFREWKVKMMGKCGNVEMVNVLLGIYRFTMSFNHYGLTFFLD